MGEFSIFYLLVVAILVVVLLFNRKIPEAMRPFGEEIIRRKRPPKHPLPVTGPIETSRPPKTSEKAVSD